MSVKAESYRLALGYFPTGIAVIAAADASGEPTGIAINSFTSVSLEPPLVLWCLNRQSRRLDTFLDAKRYSINFLTMEHSPVCAHLAQPGSHRLEKTMLADDGAEPPRLAGASAILECENERYLDGGDHIVFLGRVRSLTMRGTTCPLIYFRSEYRALTSKDDYRYDSKENELTESRTL